ncbi:hypothetical protein NQ317_002423 [Molorchus minor]|uniref:Uncharacterized protein n=1 Tax=Molorchus minor TaxID=1323400 RepID=A0ABQ9JLL4_9CUCU|nr:hypothetical protein NQ317_002423 [Molorchus minor]
MEITYEKLCRICLKDSNNLTDLFAFTLTKENIHGVDFLRNLTGQKLAKSNTLPNNICGQCKENVVSSFELAQLCIASETSLRNQETRRMLRKIEEEALGEEEIVIKCEILNENESLEVPQTDQFLSDGASNDTFSEPEETAQIAEELRFTTIRTKNRYQCDACQLCFNNKTKYLKHQNTHDNSKSFKCSECSQSFSKKIHLNNHLRSHIKEKDKKFSCEKCGQQFLFEYLLRQHEFKHSDKKPFPCSKCSKGVLKIHMRKHTNERPYVCDLCGMSFRQSADLKSHHRTHTGEKPVLCTICGKKMSTTGQLTVHLRSHTGEKPFTCTICSRSFTTRTILVKHERIHTGERPYVCDVCGKAFNQSSTLKTHSKTHKANTTKEKEENKASQE